MNNKRILIVDALRGFALLLIVLIHYVEHFDFFYNPEINFLFSPQTDGKVMEMVFFLISGKAYSIFALLFGFSFFIQMNRKEKEGIDFRRRFLWRLTVLFAMVFIHSLIYKGDILHIYAVLGIILLLLYKVNTKALWLITIVLLLQIPILIHLISSFLNPAYEYLQSFGSNYWEEANSTYANGSFFEVVSFNLWKGRTTVLGWTFYNGRYLQLPALFIVGFILGRKQIFEEISNYKKNIFSVLIGSVVLYGVIYLLLQSIANNQFTDTQKTLLNILLGSYANLAFTSVLITSIILLYLKFKEGAIFIQFSAYGKMSLSNYVFQAIFGVVFFYGFGLGMYRNLGSTWSILIGLAVFVIQSFISAYWSKKYYYGPLEWFWRSVTFFDFKTKFRKLEVKAE